MTKRIAFLHVLFLAATTSSYAQGPRSHTRPAAGTVVSQAQAADLTLTLGQVSVRPIQLWVRGAATLDGTGKVLAASLDPRDAKSVKVGQRVRAFTPETKTSMFQARVTRIVPQGGRVAVEVTLAAQGLKSNSNYVIEIVAEQGDFLSVPNEAIIEEGTQHIVYVQQQPGQYVPQEVEIGVQGELYTQILSGLSDREQVVTFGSFFIDSEYKLKGTNAPPATNEQHP